MNICNNALDRFYFHNMLKFPPLLCYNLAFLTPYAYGMGRNLWFLILEVALFIYSYFLTLQIWYQKYIFFLATTMSDTLINGFKIITISSTASIGEKLTPSKFFVKIKSWYVSWTNSGIAFLRTGIWKKRAENLKLKLLTVNFSLNLSFGYYYW